MDFHVEFNTGGDIPQVYLHIRIFDSQVAVLCKTEQPASLSLLSRIVLGRVQALVNPTAFMKGTGLFVLLETVSVDNGKPRRFFYTNPEILKVTATLNLERVQRLMLEQPDVAIALNELVEALAFPTLIAVNCARSIEGLRAIITPNDPKRDQGWAAMRNQLRISRPYLEYITNTSANPRHGDRTELRPEVLEVVLSRAWKVMERFIQYRLREDSELPADLFPVLE